MSISIIKKAAALLCSAATALSVSAALSLSASAAGSTIRGEQKIAAPGETVTYSVSIENNSGYCALGLAVVHAEGLEVQGVEGRSIPEVNLGDGAKGLSGTLSYKADTRKVALSTMGSGANCKTDGTIFTFSVKVPDDAKNGDVFDMDIVDPLTQFVNADGEDQSPYTVVDGWIKIVAETEPVTVTTTTTTEETTTTTTTSSEEPGSITTSDESTTEGSTTTTESGSEGGDTTSNGNGGSDVPGPKTGETGAALAVAGLLTAAGAAYAIRRKH